MEARGKLEKLAKAAQYDLACACGAGQNRTHGLDGRWIYPAALPNGGTMPMLKVLQTSGCERNCAYCAERSGGLGQSMSFTPDELAGLFSDMVRTRMVGGLFLSSAIKDSAIATMDKMLATAELVRFKHRFFGFVHLKIIPGAENSQIIRAMELANRVSINLETPDKDNLKKIAPGKNFFGHLQNTINFVGEHLGQDSLRCRSQTTQFVVGASSETDEQILSTLWQSYRQMNLARGYFSAFQPVQGTPLEGRSPTPTMREHRLYQADFLIRKYQFSFDDIIFDSTSNLSLITDPKTLWVGRHPELFPMEINEAPKKLLLRVPGIGPQSAEKIMRVRKNNRIQDLDALKIAASRWKIAAPYLLFDGRLRTKSSQLKLFPGLC
ncbi:MAG: putative DNA modification/repair radical SAM protein [Proteobacteria bacterium]|nr:putative DNA modification/repair radical SAM protein [Pseudomonadota bacterium]